MMSKSLVFRVCRVCGIRVYRVGGIRVYRVWGIRVYRVWGLGPSCSPFRLESFQRV